MTPDEIANHVRAYAKRRRMSVIQVLDLARIPERSFREFSSGRIPRGDSFSALLALCVKTGIRRPCINYPSFSVTPPNSHAK